ncbi:hypothetical protein C1H70_16880 [Halomonas urumqiensis]|uniref:Uncharacterized protein n=1 Tax=Halomonas urumqiensis TaxID=1684789 RepID=A0A2N7UDC1_9GAMM|nr:hypothetical protein C1H70_16880 [Halomonas urumqiensis]
MNLYRILDCRLMISADLIMPLYRFMTGKGMTRIMPVGRSRLAMTGPRPRIRICSGHDEAFDDEG